MQRSVVVVDLQTVEYDVAILCTPARYTAGAPCCGKFDRHVIRFLEGVFEINGMDPVGMLKGPFLGGVEDANREQRTLTRARGPAWNFQIEFRHQRRFCTLPIRLVG